MDKLENGGPAFPIEFNSMDYNRGMSLRDWFAGQALAGLLADPEMNADPHPTARCAYNYADAMLAARKAR